MADDATAPNGVSTFDARVKFTVRPRLIRADERIAWRLASLVLLLSAFNRNAASIRHLHVMGWALRSGRSRSAFLALWQGRRAAASMLERLDPNLMLTLNLALAHGLVDLISEGRRVTLTSSGEELAREINEHPTILRVERDFIGSLGTRLSDSRMDKMFGARVSGE